MSNYLALYVHLVWATLGRQPLVSAEIEGNVHACIAYRCRRMRCIPWAVGGMPDHIHLLVELHPTVSVSSLMQDVKGASSHMINHSLRAGPEFRWQSGFGAFTFRQSEMPSIRDYVLRQKHHHAARTISLPLESMPGS
jgi:REP element-mobilizing transposase RayT